MDIIGQVGLKDQHMCDLDTLVLAILSVLLICLFEANCYTLCFSLIDQPN